MHAPAPSPRIIAIEVATEVGRPPAVIISRCRVCAAALADYLSLNGLANRTAEIRGCGDAFVTELAVAYADAVLAAFRAWWGVAVHGEVDHLYAFTIGERP
jgi:hypothetical protein